MARNPKPYRKQQKLSDRMLNMMFRLISKESKRLGRPVGLEDFKEIEKRIRRSSRPH